MILRISSFCYFGLLLLIVSACQPPPLLIDNKNGLAEVKQFYSYPEKQPFKHSQLQDATKFVIYLPGTSTPRRRINCDDWSTQVPESLLVLANDPNTYVYYLCSNAKDIIRAGSYLDQRLDELIAVLRALNDLGVAPANIFLAGHSAGAWVTLLAAKDYSHYFNATIAYAPACCGVREESEIFPVWRARVRPASVEKMLQAETIRALVFAYGDDPFNRPQDLQFLTDRYPKSTLMHAYNCGGAHNTHVDDCRIADTQARISEYVRLRLDDYSSPTATSKRSLP